MKKMTVREYAKFRGFEVVGKLKRLADADSAKLWMDEAGNEYWENSNDGYCIITADGGVI